MQGGAVRVGLFDSGIGGLSVLKECVRLYPGAEYFYYGDNKRAPYGSRPPEEILSFTEEGIRALLAEGADVLILACNTATAVCIDLLRQKHSVPIIGTEPAVKAAAKVCRRALVLATPRTAESVRLARLIQNFPTCIFTIHGAPHLAGSIEKFLTDGTPFGLEVQLPKGDFDGVVLGCTHYAFLKPQIARYYRVPVFDSGSGVAKQLVRVIKLGKIGRRDHSPSEGTDPPINERNSQKLNITFLGSGNFVNKSVFFSNICFGNFCF